MPRKPKVKRGDWAWASNTGYGMDGEKIMAKVGNHFTVPNPHRVRPVRIGLRYIYIPGHSGRDLIPEDDLEPIPREVEGHHRGGRDKPRSPGEEEGKCLKDFV